MTWIGLRLLYQKIFINPIVGLIRFYNIGTQVNFNKMKLTLKLGCLTIDFSQAREGQERKEDSDTGCLGAFSDVMRVQLLPS